MKIVKKVLVLYIFKSFVIENRRHWLSCLLFGSPMCYYTLVLAYYKQLLGF